MVSRIFKVRHQNTDSGNEQAAWGGERGLRKTGEDKGDDREGGEENGLRVGESLFVKEKI